MPVCLILFGHFEIAAWYPSCNLFHRLSTSFGYTLKAIV